MIPQVQRAWCPILANSVIGNIDNMYIILTGR